MITALLYFGGVRPVQATGRVGAKHKGGVALRGSGEAGSGWNLCDSLPACPSARSGWGLHQDHGFPRGASPPGTRGARSVSPEPGGGGGAATSRGRPRHEQPGGDARRPGPGASGGSRPRTPRSPPSRRAATPRSEPEREQLVAGAGRGVGGDLPAGDKQAINSAAKFPSARPADNRSRAHPRGHLLPLPGRTARTLAFLHARGCEAPRALCRHA